MNASSQDITADGLVSTPSSMTVVDGLSSGDVRLPDGEMALRATFTREGPDLLIEGRDGEQILVQDYFAVEEPRDLILGDGSGVLTGSLVAALAGSPTPGQYAQLETASLTAGAVGQVEALTGEAFAVRVDGTRVALEVGSPIYLGDVLETTFDGAIAVLFVDGTTFSLAEDARMVVDELIYDAGSEGNTASFSLVQGLFVLVSGDVAKTGEMVIETPVSTIGIRGTSAAFQLAAEGLQNVVTLLQDPDGNVGLIEVATAIATVILSEIGATTTVASLDQAPSAVEILEGADIEALYRAALATMQSLSDANLGVDDATDDGGDDVAEADPDAAVEAFAEAVADLFDALAAAIEEAEAELEAAGETDTDDGDETTGTSAGDTIGSLPENERNNQSFEAAEGGSGGATNNPPAGDLLLVGLVVEDAVLTADVSGISDADGLGEFSYQWQALTDTGWTDIAGATDDTFTPGDNEVGSQIRVVVSYVDGGGTAESVTSEPTVPIVNVDDPAEGDVLITGVAQEDVPLTADASGLSDADGLGALSYQWQVQTGAGWTDITGATDGTFTPGDDEVGSQVRVVVSYTDGGGNAESVASGATAPIANVNDELEGTAAIVGLAQENALLTADTSDLSDADGLGDFGYQWQALTDTGWTDIAGATGDTFTPDDAQVGSQLRVIVSYTDGEGTPETTTSAATDAIANVDDAPTGDVTVTGVVQEDSLLTADTSNLSDADGLGVFSYQWQALTDTGWADITGATDDTFTPGDDEVGLQVRVAVSYTDGGGNAENVASDGTIPVANVNDEPAGDLIITGIAQEDAPLAADTSGLGDADGLGDFNYQWQALTDTGWSDIAGATDDTFTPGDNEVGSQVRVVVSYTDGEGTQENITSAPTDVVTNVDDTPDGDVTVTGVPQEDATLTADTSNLSDADGLGAFSYQWQSLTDAGWSDITGATDDTFMPGDDEVGSQVRVVVSYTDGGGNPESVTSAATGAVANVDDAPEGDVTVTGVPQEDAPLTADTSNLSDADGLGAFNYQWQALTDTGWSDITGATDDTFTPGDNEVGSQVRVVVSYTDGGGNPESVASGATDPVSNVNDALQGEATIDGIAQENALLTANTSGLSDADGLGAFSYQWQALTDAGWSDIAGATDDTFTPDDAQVGSQMRVIVSYTDGEGTPETTTSAATDVIANIDDAPDGDVAITGVPQEDAPLTADTSGLSDADGLGEFSYQWQALTDAGWSDITGATDDTFTPGDDEVGSQIRVVVSYTDGGGNPESVESAASVAVANVDDAPEGDVTVTGVPQEDAPLIADTSNLSDADGLGEFGYQWQALTDAGWSDITGATDDTFTPGDDEVGSQVRVVVSYTDGGGNPESIESDPTAAIANVDDAPEGDVTVAGVAQEDSPLSADTSNLSDADGLGELSYQWQALTDAGWSDITGATDDTFTPGDDEVGSQVRVVVSYTDGGGNAESVESAATAEVGNVNDVPAGVVTVSGVAQEDAPLAADSSGLSDADGLGEFSYQWQALTDGGWSNITGATDVTFTPGDDEVGSQVRVVVSYTDGGGNPESVESDPTAVVANVNDEPAGGVTVDGIAQEDSELSANTDGLSDADGLGEFGYRWQAFIDDAWVDVAGATDDTFTPGDDEVGLQVRVVVSYTDGGGTAESVESDPTAAIGNVNDEPAGAVTIDGVADEDSELTANTDGLSDDDGLGAFSYQWQALTDAGWSNIAGATDDTFTPGDDEVGFQLRVVVSYTDGGGNAESVESAATDNVGNVNDDPEGDVTIGGEAEENSELTADASDLSDADGLGEFSYQWQTLTDAGWVNIVGATLVSFTPGEGEIGSQLRVVVSYTDGQGTEESVASAATPEVDGEAGEIDVVVNDAGEVFIQGTFVELGVSANGSLGTVGAAPDTFEAAGQPGNAGLSFYASDQPLAEGNNGTGDAFIPGSPVENFTLAFTDLNGSFVGSNENAGLGTDIPMTVESTSSSDGVGSVTMTGNVNDTAEISQTVSLGADDTYYTTSVTITNTGDETLTGLRYMRNNDPDQEVNQTGDFDTSNDVLLNPNGSNGVAAVNADGLTTGQGILLVADQNALNDENGLDDGAIQVRASAYGFENLNPFNPNGFDNPADPDGAIADIGINLVYVLPDLAPGESVTITWVTSTNTASDGNDYLVARADETLVDGGNGDDIIFAAREDTAETLVGGNGVDALFAFSTGATGDNLVGGNGQDVLSSGGGADSLTGGLGADRFFYNDVEDGHVIATNTAYSEIAAPEADTIVDFNSGLDVIQLLSSAFGDMPVGELTEGVNFSVIVESYDGTNAGTNANHAEGLASFVYSTADGTLHYDGNGADAGYTAVAQMDQPSASDVEIVASA